MNNSRKKPRVSPTTATETATSSPEEEPETPSMAAAATSSSRNWAELPRDVVSSILMRLGAIDVLTSAQQVCSSWRSVCREPSMWRSIDMHSLGDLRDMEFDLEKVCREAVDRSAGGLVDINIERFGTDHLLAYISDRSSHLKRLRLASCNYISDEGLITVAPKFPLLEVLEMSNCSFTKKAVEAVGQHCPFLRSFKLNVQGYKRPHIECDEKALAIAETMPGLRYLQIFGNKLTNIGLQAILDGCPHLEFLDLRQCFNVSLDGNLGKICAERIKDLQGPDDPMDDYNFDPESPDIGSSVEGYPTGFSDIDIFSDDDDYYEFSGDSDF